MASRNNTPNRQTAPGQGVPRILSAQSQQMMQITLMRLDTAKHVLGELAALDIHRATMIRDRRIEALLKEEVMTEPAFPGDIIKPRLRTEDEAKQIADNEGMDLHRQGFAQAALSYADHLLAAIGLINLQDDDKPEGDPPSSIAMP